MFSHQAEPPGFPRHSSGRVDYEAAALEATKTQTQLKTLQQSTTEHSCVAIQHSQDCMLAAEYSLSGESEKVGKEGDADGRWRSKCKDGLRDTRGVVKESR